MFLNIVFVLVGLALLFFGGEGLVRGSVNLASKLGLSALLVSLVIVGFGTSVPELLVCLKAAFSGVPDMAVGNVIGSNIANTFMILGISAVIFPLACGKKTILRDSAAVIIASFVLTGFILMNTLSFVSGLSMLCVLVAYLVYSYKTEKIVKEPEKSEVKELKDRVIEDTGEKTDSILKSLGILFISILMLGGGADLLVRGASEIARSFGVSEVVIGLSLVAIGTSLPELATAIVASIKKHGDVIIGNVLGSNLFNILGILGTTAMVSPLPVSERVISIDVWILLASALILFPVILTGHKISRAEGAAFLLCYTLYITMMYV